MFIKLRTSKILILTIIKITAITAILFLSSCSSTIRFAEKKNKSDQFGTNKNSTQNRNTKENSSDDIRDEESDNSVNDDNYNSNSIEFTEDGFASYYGVGFDGRTTASGEVFDKSKFTAAHRTLQFGTIVQVKNMRNGKIVIVRINDRGPHIAGRIIDLSETAAREIDMINDGVVPVEIQTLK